MLLAGLKSEHICTLAVNVVSSPDNTSRKFAYMVFLTCKEAHVWATVAKRNTQRLRISAHDVSAPLTRSLDHCK